VNIVGVAKGKEVSQTNFLHNKCMNRHTFYINAIRNKHFIFCDCAAVAGDSRGCGGG
jgi:hypothetical protein